MDSLIFRHVLLQTVSLPEKRNSRTVSEHDGALSRMQAQKPNRKDGCLMRTMQEYLKLIEENLPGYLTGLGEIPDQLLKPMLYALEGGGKRIRPVMLLAAMEMAGGKAEDALPFACALEMIHTYSLIHDDLPAMDNDDMRRGRKSCHIVFGEDMAILAGDGLLSAASELLMRSALNFQDQRGTKAAWIILRRAGVCGMAAGQSVDVTMEGQPVQEDVVRYIHMHKTADLLSAPIEAGLILAGCSDETVKKGEDFGHHLGLAFQMVDDLLDEIGDAAVMGKETHMDAALGKQTWTALKGLDGTREDIRKETESAISCLEGFGQDAEFFRKLARDLAERIR